MRAGGRLVWDVAWAQALNCGSVPVFWFFRLTTRTELRFSACTSAFQLIRRTELWFSAYTSPSQLSTHTELRFSAYTAELSLFYGLGKQEAMHEC